MRDYNLTIDWGIRYFWVGVCWKRDGNCFDMWVCLLPFIPVHFSCWGKSWGMPSLDPDELMGSEDT